MIALFNEDPKLLDGLHVPKASELPSGIEYIDPIPALSDKDLHNELLSELGELEPVYSDPTLLKQMIELWSRISHNNFLLLWQTTLYKYNPIWNKDGTFTETRELTGNKLAVGNNTVNNSGTSAETRELTGNVLAVGSDSVSGSESVDTTTSGSESSTNDETVTHHVTGYDTNSMSPAYDDVTDGSGSRTTSGTTNVETASLIQGNNRLNTDTEETETTNGQTTESSQGSSRMNTDNTETETITRTERGNIGVTTTQAMVREQRDIVTFNVYSYIIEAFKKRFMVQVY